MPDILHRISIDAPAERVHELIATADGIARWWTGRPLDGSAEIGGHFGVFFADTDKPAAVMRVVADTRDQITWRVEEGPDAWVGTLITFTLRPHGDDGTTLLFTHAGWQEASEFMSGCSTNWGAYLTSLKTGAESGQFAAYPRGEISRWSGTRAPAPASQSMGHFMLIHQEAIINADPQAVYEVLTDGQKFAAATGMPARLSDREGETFTLFDGRVEGRQIELVPGQRVVQAWRFGARHPSCWDAGVYSVVRFTLSGQEDGTRFIIDHTGVPPEWHDHISTGYPSFYQQPLERYFASLARP